VNDEAEQPVVEPQAEATEEEHEQPSPDQGDPAKAWDDLTEREQIARLRAYMASTHPGDRVTVLPESLQIVIEDMGNGQGGKAVTLIDEARAESVIFRLMTTQAIDAFVANLTEKPSGIVAGADALAELAERKRIEQHNLRVARAR
jgi:hypothetical protein